jgi:hypothetical protein
MNFDFDFPEITEGYYKIMNFPQALKSHDLEINTAIEFAHIIRQNEGDYKVEKVQSYHYRQHNIECLIFLRIGDRFNCKSRRLKRNSKSLKFIIPSYENIEFESYNHIRDGFNISERSDGFKFYSFERRFGYREPITIIVPVIVIGQAFWLNNSLIIRNLFRNNFDEFNELIRTKETTENDRVIGNIYLRKPVEEIVKSMVKSLSFFLFSKDNYLKKNLSTIQSNLYSQLLNSPEKIDYNFTIPIKQDLKMKFGGRYLNKEDRTYFIVEEIIELDPENNFSNLYIVDDFRFYDYIGESTNTEKSKSTRYHNTRKNKEITAINGNKNPDLAKNFVESGLDFLSQIVKLSIEYKASAKSKTSEVIIKPSSEFGTFNTKTSDPYSNSAELTGSKKNVENKNSNSKAELFLLLREIIKKLQSKYDANEIIIDNDDLIIFDMSNNGHHVLLLDDMVHRRIQILYKVDLKTFDKNAINNLVKLIVDNNYSWEKLKNESKESVGIKLDETMVKIGVSTNYNIEGKRTIKNTKLSNGTENRITVENLCYQNILKKLENLFPYSKE